LVLFFLFFCFCYLSFLNEVALRSREARYKLSVLITKQEYPLLTWLPSVIMDIFSLSVQARKFWWGFAVLGGLFIGIGDFDDDSFLE
jgi:hypothetical protein